VTIYSFVQSLLLLALALAQAPGGGGLVEDFEGAAADGWERVTSDPYPPYNTVERVRNPEEAKSRSQFLRLHTMGGPTAVRRSALRPWAIEAGRPYRLSVWARLRRTKRNRASLSVSWVGSSGDPLLDQRSQAVDRTEGWTLLVIDLPRTPPGATGLLPCLNFDGDDVRGICDFDLLTLVPVELLEARPVGRRWPVFTPEEFPRFSITLAGLPDGVHSVTAALRLAEGPEIRRAATIRVPADQPAIIDFPPAPVGAHDLVFSVDGHGARESMALLVPPTGLSMTEAHGDDSTVAFPSAGAALKSRLLDRKTPIALLPYFVDEANGLPTRALYTLRLIDEQCAHATSIADPGLFPASVRVAAFRKDTAAFLALWCEAGETEVVAGLHEGLKIQPPFGALRELKLGERIKVGALPVLLLDLDPLWTELRFTLSAAELPLQQGPSRISARLENRSRVEIPRDVAVTLENPPAGWRIAPRRYRTAALAPDAVHAEDLDITLPPTESERVQDLRFELRFSIQGRESVMHVVRPLQLKSALGIETTVVDGPMAGSKKLTLRILNGSDRMMGLTLRARVPGVPERLDLVRDLGAGGRSATFEYAAQGTTGVAEFVVQETGGDRATARRTVALR